MHRKNAETPKHNTEIIPAHGATVSQSSCNSAFWIPDVSSTIIMLSNQILYYKWRGVLYVYRILPISGINTHTDEIDTHRKSR